MQSINQIVTANKQAGKALPTSKPTTANPTKGQYLAVAELLVPGFEVDEQNRELLRLLYAYAVRDPYFTQQGYCLDKGLLLYGNVGSGKTAQMKVLQRVFNLMQSGLAFAYGTVAHVADLFGQTGFEAFLSYKKRHYLFDELGRLDRETVMWYGNKVNVAESLIQNRYELFTRGTLTHFTTNLSKAELATHYDARVWSRLQEMCNLLKATAPDRRPLAQSRTIQVVKVIPAAPKQQYTDEMKRDTILAEVEKMRANPSYTFLDVGGVHYGYLLECGLIEADDEIEAEELHRMIANARVTDLDTQSRKALKQFQEAEELPEGNKYTKELAFRIEKRLLKEALIKLANNSLILP